MASATAALTSKSVSRFGAVTTVSCPPLRPIWMAPTVSAIVFASVFAVFPATTALPLVCDIELPEDVVRTTVSLVYVLFVRLFKWRDSSKRRSWDSWDNRDNREWLKQNHLVRSLL
jgi:hypothetical protein